MEGSNRFGAWPSGLDGLKAMTGIGAFDVDNSE
jgi:hypothetical protein